MKKDRDKVKWKGWGRAEILTVVIGLAVGFVFFIYVLNLAPPDNTAEATVTDAELEYLEPALGYAGRIAEISMEHGDDIEEFFEEELSPIEFYNNIEERQEELKQIISEVEDLTPPDNFKEFHELILKASRDIDRSFDTMLEYLESPSEELLESSLKQFEEGIVALNQAGEIIEPLVD